MGYRGHFEDDYGSRHDFGEKDEGEEFEVEVVKATEKALLCRFDDGDERWIPKSQIADDSEVVGPGDKGTLIITSWLAQKMAEENESEAKQERPVAIPGCVCLRETEAALMIRVPGHEEPVWFPKSHVRGGEVQHDGDVGVFQISAWISKQKGVGPQGELALGEQDGLDREQEAPSRERKPRSVNTAAARRTAQDDIFDDGDPGGRPPSESEDPDDGVPF